MSKTRKYYRADFSDPAYPQVRSCHITSAAATTYRQARKEVEQTMRQHLLHWKEQIRCFKQESQEDVDRRDQLDDDPGDNATFIDAERA